MNKLKRLFDKRESKEVNIRESSKDGDINAAELAKYIRRLEAENKKLKDSKKVLISEKKTISYQLGKVIIDTLNNKSVSKDLPSKLLDIYIDSRKRKYLYLEDAPFIDKLIIFLNDDTLLQGHRLKNIEPNTKIDYSKNDTIDKKLDLESSNALDLPSLINEVSHQQDRLFGEQKPEVPQVEEKAPLGSLTNQDTIQLTQNVPIWYEIPVCEGQELKIEAASEYRNITDNFNRKALLLIKSFDSNGDEVDKPCGKMSHSPYLDTYFKYLPSTDNRFQELHTFIVPKDVSKIHIGMCGFNQNKEEQVFIRHLNVQPKFVKSQVAKFVPPSAQSAEISILGWPEVPVSDKPCVIGIMDEFTTGCFEQDLNLIQPRPDNWYALAEKYKPVLFFIESAWKGNYGSWQYRVGEYANKPGREIENICEYARHKGIPTLFWNKEDPVHHYKFMGSAKLVDYIYTTDGNMKESYTEKTGNEKVYSLPFAAQPALHKPASLKNRKPLTCFAGSWYGNRHAERGDAMGWLLTAANKYGLEIYDRNYGTGIFPFPQEYQAGIKGSLPYKELCAEYSRYRVFLNVNSVTDSPTMFSRRVFELMASGTPVVSTYAKGIDNLFESDAVWLVNSQEEANEAIHTLMTDDAEWRRRSLAGIREIFSKHTYAHRLNNIFEDMGIDNRIATDPNVILFAQANNQTEIDKLNLFAKNQDYRNFRLVIECTQNMPMIEATALDNIVILQSNQKDTWLIENQNLYSVAGWITPNSNYGKYYLRDLVNASIYEPDAHGWAKSLNEDMFAYTQPAALCGTLWKISIFIQNHINAKANTIVEDCMLYIADSDQFESGYLVPQDMRGVK